MSDKEETTKSKKTPKFNHNAYGLTKDQNGVWQMVKIQYNLETGNIGDISVVEMEDLRYGFERVQVELELEALGNQK